MFKWALTHALDELVNNAADNKDWDCYWKVRHIIEETYGCKFSINSYGLDGVFKDHRFTEVGTLK